MMHFVGLANYTQIFTNDPDFNKSLWVTMAYVLMTLPMKLIFSLFIALLVNNKIRGVGIYRTVYYLPSILGGSVTVALLWQFLFERQGIVNTLMAKFGIPFVDWMGDPHISLFTLSLLSVWQFGSSMVLFLAGLKQIPVELYEAGRVDGASRSRMFFNITLPMLSPIIFFNLVIQLIGTFQEFTAAYVVTQGGPIKSTYVYALFLYDQAFKFYKMGYASALSWVFFIIIMAITALLFKSSSLWTFYEDGGK